MAAPWEKYAQSGGPWERYAQPPAPEKSFGLGFMKGGLKPLDNLGRAFEAGLEKIGVPVDRIGQAVSDATGGIIAPTTRAAMDQRQAFYDRKAQEGVLPSGVGEFVGNVVGTLPVGALPGGAFVQGAAAGGLLTDADTPGGVAMDAALGGVAGKVGEKVLRGVGRVIAPKTAPAARKLLDEGVQLTPGQLAGGTTRRVEDAATTIPYLGDAIKAAQRRGIQSFNRAAINRSLAPIGEKLPKELSGGHEAISFAGSKLKNAYDTLLPKLKVEADDVFREGVRNLDDLARNMPAEKYRQFQRMMQRDVLDKFTGIGRMSGQTMKEVETKLGQMIRLYGRSQSPDDQYLANAFREAQSLLRGVVERSNPAQAKQLANINQGYAHLIRLESAAGRVGAQEGVFTPAQLLSATRGADSSVRKRASAQGGALLQDLAEAGKSTMAQSIPDSGTATRGLIGVLAATGGAGAINPTAGAGVLGAASLYTPAGQKALTHMMATRPEIAQQLAAYLARMETPAIVGGAAMAVSGQ